MKRFLMLAAVFLLAVTPLAFADTVTVFNFNQNLGDLGKSDLVKSGLLNFVLNGYSGPGVQADLWEKNLGSDEFGLGLAGEINREINTTDFIQADVSKLLALKSSPIVAIILSFNSIQAGESYDIFGSNVAGQLGTELADAQTSATFTLPDLGKYQFYSVQAESGNITLDDVHIVTRTPEPATLPLLGVGLVFVTIFARRLRVKHG